MAGVTRSALTCTSDFALARVALRLSRRDPGEPSCCGEPWLIALLLRLMQLFIFFCITTVLLFCRWCSIFSLLRNPSISLLSSFSHPFVFSGESNWNVTTEGWSIRTISSAFSITERQMQQNISTCATVPTQSSPNDDDTGNRNKAYGINSRA